MAEQIRVTHIVEAVETDERGKLRPFMRVTFMVGDHGPFTERFSKAGFDPLAARRQLEQFAQTLATLSRL